MSWKRILRAILLWFAERGGEPDDVHWPFAKLDEAMVTGGQTWAELLRRMYSGSADSFSVGDCLLKARKCHIKAKGKLEGEFPQRFRLPILGSSRVCLVLRRRPGQDPQHAAMQPPLRALGPDALASSGKYAGQSLDSYKSAISVLSQPADQMQKWSNSQNSRRCRNWPCPRPDCRGQDWRFAE